MPRARASAQAHLRTHARAQAQHTPLTACTPNAPPLLSLSLRSYRLKSVAHLPQRAYMYKFLTTIIDDLFAFVIKMPTLHRIAVFRDDVVFMLLIIQRDQYPIDLSRKNEYGTSARDEQVSQQRKRGERRVCRRGTYETRALPPP